MFRYPLISTLVFHFVLKYFTLISEKHKVRRFKCQIEFRNYFLTYKLIIFSILGTLFLSHIIGRNAYNSRACVLDQSSSNLKKKSWSSFAKFV